MPTVAPNPQALADFSRGADPPAHAVPVENRGPSALGVTPNAGSDPVRRVHNAQGEVLAAIGLGAHTSMIASAEMVDQFLPHLLATADDISTYLGYRRENPHRT